MQRFVKLVNEYDIPNFNVMANYREQQKLIFDRTRNQFWCHSKIRLRTPEERAKQRYYKNINFMFVVNMNTQF